MNETPPKPDEPLVTSKRVLVVSHCILNQNVMATGCANYTAVVSPVLKFAIDHELGLFQLPCPEILFAGLPRLPKGKKLWKTPEFRSHCQSLAVKTFDDLALQINGGVQVVAGIVVTFSPACSGEQINNFRPLGIFFEAMENEQRQRNWDWPWLTVTGRYANKMTEDLKKLAAKLKAQRRTPNE